MARRLDSESEKMANFLRLERRIISRERLRATSSAVKMLAEALYLLMTAHYYINNMLIKYNRNYSCASRFIYYRSHIV